MAKHKKNAKKNQRGHKKGNCIHGRAAGKKGEAAAYMTRATALAKLQVSLADFRRLCILKGVYPRDPKKKNDGNDKTYYHAKDILFLSHEPLLNKFFEMKTFMKKFKRLMGRNERTLAKNFEDRKPEYTVHHLVRERYPAFNDAVRDLDDAISMLALFQALSADQKREIPIEAVNEATRLYQEFQLYVIRAQALRKVFVSIKGYYFQAEICGQLVTWLVPHQFAQALPPEVDFRVMLTFLEFYRAMVKFVNYKLYMDLGLEYPPKRNVSQEAASAEVAALEIAEMKDAGKGRTTETDADATADDVVADFGEQSKEAVEMHRQAEEKKRMKTVFRQMRIFINREVSLRPAYFVLLCGGVSEVGWERGAHAKRSAGEGSAFGEQHKNITHQVVDRPPEQLERREGREYVQPQWIFDSFNIACQLPIAPYAPGRAPPPHLSPFVDDAAEGYVPRQREILDRFAKEVAGTPGSAGDAAASGTGPGQEASAPQGTFEEFSKELRAEAKGVWHADFREQEREAAGERAAAAGGEMTGSPKLAAEGDPPLLPPPVRPTEDEEDHLRRKALMPKKHKRLLQRIEKSAKLKDDHNTNLKKKRKVAESA